MVPSNKGLVLNIVYRQLQLASNPQYNQTTINYQEQESQEQQEVEQESQEQREVE
jgi:hypothetical protein